MPPKLSVVVITLNEEKNIARCLKSLGFKAKPEVIVVDAQSKDKTVALARKMRARVFTRRWKGYADQKNWAFTKCGGNWILSLDADEELTPELCREIEGKLAEAPKADGFFIKRRAFFLGKWIRHCGWWPDAQMRLIRKGKGKFSNRPVHEGLEVKGPALELAEAMNHYTYDSIPQYLEKMERYSDLFLLSDSAKRKKKLWLAYLLFMPGWQFFKMYFLKLGLLDGWRGLQVCGLSAYHEYVKYRKLGRS